MKKRGRKPLDPAIKHSKKRAEFWNSLCLDLRILDQFQLLNECYPESKQIYWKEPIFSKRCNKGVRIRQVKKQDNNVALIDCRSIRQLERWEEELNKKSIIHQEKRKNLPPQQQESEEKEQSQINQNQCDSFISSNMSVICLTDQMQQKQYKHTQLNNPSISQSLQGIQSTRQIPRYLQFEPSPPSSPSLSLIQPLSKSFVNRFMDDSFVDGKKKQDWSLTDSILENNCLQNAIHSKTYELIKNKFTTLTQDQYEKLLQAYNHNYQILQNISFTNPNQIQGLLLKYSTKKL